MMTFKQFLQEADYFNYWASFPYMPGGRKFTNNIVAEVARKVKLSPSNIKVKQYLNNINAFTQTWEITVPKKLEGNEELLRSMLLKSATSHYSEYFQTIESRQGEIFKMPDGKSKIIIFFRLTR